MKILILCGGDSPEREVSLRSGAAVYEAVEKAGFEVQLTDPIEPDWVKRLDGDTITFPILHGSGGEDGTVQQLLEDKGMPFLGSSAVASRLCFDKQLTRQLLAEYNISLARGEYVDHRGYELSQLRRSPHVLKTPYGGSSIGTLVVRHPDEVSQNDIDDIFAYGEKAVLEELVEGVEITIPILDNKALPVIEIKPPKDAEFDYENKYNGKTAEICPAVSLTAGQQMVAQKIAEEVHVATGARHFSRVDMIMREGGTFVVLEINTIPGMTNQSLYPASASVAGYPMPELMKQFVALVKRDYNLS